jgi:uncharacterized protein YjbI with pentapeptide repeats
LRSQLTHTTFSQLTVSWDKETMLEGSVIQFLYESGLISKGKCIVDLEEATLREADLSKAILTEADLRAYSKTLRYLAITMVARYLKVFE